MVDGQPLPDPALGLAKAEAWYIESSPVAGELVHSCSFVEFDERGDYLDFNQHRHAYEKIRALAETHEHLIVVIYVHGWRNSGQSGDVVSFNEFLHQVGTFSGEQGEKHRVHGVYIAWRGGCLRPAVDREDAVFKRVQKCYGGDEIVGREQAARWGKFNQFIETFSYFDRKGVPEHMFSGTAFSRTLFSCAHVAKRYFPNTKGNQAGDERKKHHHVFLIGHSLGGLMLERTFQNATIGELTRSWPWGDPELIAQAKANPLPFDTVLLVNSAAPSIYAKQFQSYLAGHRQAMIRDKVKGANSPIFFSLTSDADWATGKIHYWANSLSYLVPTLKRPYFGKDFILVRNAANDAVRIPQAYYYRRTPGHNPLLVNRFIEQGKQPQKKRAVEKPSESLHDNLRATGNIFDFDTSPREGEMGGSWTIQFPPETAEYVEFSKFEGKLPVVWTKHGTEHPWKESAYWIVRCPREIITGHNDIWSQQAMETYAALYRISDILREQQPT